MLPEENLHGQALIDSEKLSKHYIPHSYYSEWEDLCCKFESEMVVLDANFEALKMEKIRGWRSPAVDLAWHFRSAQLDAVQVKQSREQGFSPSPKKYYAHYLQIFEPFKDFFIRPKQRHAPKFIDVGAAPGGLCRTLCGDWKWEGLAISLPPEMGGFEMKFQKKGALDIYYTDVSPADGWSELVDVADMAVGLADSGPGSGADFVNLGVVVDKKQRGQIQSRLGEEGGAGEFDAAGEGDEEDGRAKVGLDSSVPMSVVVQTEVMGLHIWRNQLLLMLHTLNKGGAAQFVAASSRMAALCWVLGWWDRLFDKVVVNPTAFLTRAPVYILGVGYKGQDSEAANELRQILMNNSPEVGNTEVWKKYHCLDVDAVSKFWPKTAADLERIWSRQTEELRSFRQRAEAVVEQYLEPVPADYEIGDGSSPYVQNLLSNLTSAQAAALHDLVGTLSGFKKA